MEKINIYVPDRIGSMLENDAIMFEVYKKDGRTINKNKFLSMLIIGFYYDYVTEEKKAYDSILATIDTDTISRSDKERIAINILDNIVRPTIPSRKGKNPSRLSLKPTKETETLINKIMIDMDKNDAISQYFCRMFMSYCEKPFSKREKIIFNENYELLQMACEMHKSITFKTIWNKNNIHEVIPYKIVTGAEEMFNYLLCSKINTLSGKQEAMSFRLNRIDKINYARSVDSIDDKVKQHLNLMIKYGPQYMINDDDESCVRLSDSGVLNFSRIYYGRPLVDRVEEKEDGHYYFFKCSKDQLFLYFRRFGYKDAEILSPQSLRTKMIEFHSMAYKMYIEGENNG